MILQEGEIAEYYSESGLRTRLEAIFATILASKKRDILSKSTSSARSALYQTARWVSGGPLRAKGSYKDQPMKINTCIDYALCHGKLETISDIKLVVIILDAGNETCARKSLGESSKLCVTCSTVATD